MNLTIALKKAPPPKKNHHTHKERENKKKGTEKNLKIFKNHPKNDEQTGNKYMPINSCFKCKWTKFTSQKTWKS